MSNTLYSGAGTAEVSLKGVLPIEGFSAARDALKCRAIILESNIRVAIASAAITSLPDETTDMLIEVICNSGGISRENVWFTLTHSFAGPHLFHRQKDAGRHPKEELERSEKLEQAYLNAMESAVKSAAANMQEAVIGAGYGESMVNTNRNILTNAGWTLGAGGEPCDHRLNVIRIDSVKGCPIAVIYNYGARSSVMSAARDENGGKVLSSDLCGETSRILEEAMGEGSCALFLCGAAADQDPLFTAKYAFADINGDYRERSYSDKADVLLEVQAERLASDVLTVRRGIETDAAAPDITSLQSSIICERKKAALSGEPEDQMKPGEYIPDGAEEQKVSILRLGCADLCGFVPEIDGQTAQTVYGFSDKRVMIAACMVNGGGKCMPTVKAYDLGQFPGSHSPYMPGTAEKVTEHIREVLNNI